MTSKKQPKGFPENAAGRASARLFVQGLLRWNASANDRHMPWKGEKDPYRIWLSEIILQQTRVEQGLHYYENFISTFPDVHALANAPEEQVFKLWEGLGYYTRCRNLIRTARHISTVLKGVFPADYSSLLELRGVGPYTAAAIASFAYNLPHAVLDGNVFRVLSRIFDISLPVDTTEGKKYFAALAQQILPAGQAGAYNQAIMDFGAVVCKPSPRCADCFFRAHCRAFAGGCQEWLPIKEKKGKIRERWFHYFVIRCGGRLAIRQRKEKDIWQQLFEFPLIETAGPCTVSQLMQELEEQYGIRPGPVTEVVQQDQRLTHQLIHFNFLRLHCADMQEVAGCTWMPGSELHRYAFPRTLQPFVNGHGK